MKIAIIGAGLNGLACAVMLRRFGYDVNVFERGREPRDAGTGVYIWPQGIQVLRFLFDDDGFLSKGHPISRLDTHDRHGRLVHSAPVRLDGFDFPAPAMMFRRSTLFHMLLSQLPEEIIHYGMNCESVAEQDEKATVSFDHGESRAFDLVIGADGVFSTVRRYVNPQMQPYDTGVAASRGIVQFDDPLLHVDRCQIFTAPYARIVTYCINEAQSLRYWFAAYQHQNQPLLARAGIRALFDGLPEPLLDMISGTAQHDILDNHLRAVTGTGNWHRGRVALLGDSAHAMLPTLGYGLTLGLENGFMLTQALLGCCDPVPGAALRRYQTRAAERSQEMLRVMTDVSELYYCQPEGSVTPERLQPIMSRFSHLAETTVF